MVIIKQIFKAKNPSGVSIILGMTLLIISQTFSLVMIRMDSDDLLDIFFFGSKIVFICVSATLIVITIVRMSAKPFTLQIQDDSLYIKHRKLNAAEVKEIRIQGYFKPLIGIIPVGKRITPIHLAFRFFSEEEDKAIKELTEWANKHHITVLTHRRIKRWI